jgi:glycogen(starch) synthase
MRVLLTTDTIGGVWTFTKDLTAELLAQGNAVALISFGRVPSPSQLAWCGAREAQYGDDFVYAPSTAPLEWMNDNQSAYTMAISTILNVVEKFSPNLIHSNQFCFGSLPLAIPVLVTAHSDVLSWAEACLPNGLEPSPWLTQYKSLVHRGLTDASAVVAPTRWMLDALRNNFTFTASAHVILNGRSLLPAIEGESRRVQAVSVGRLWDKAKNLALLAEVESPMPIFIAGELSHEDAPAPAHPESLRMLGVLDEKDLLRVFHTSSVYIAPSLYEPFGLAPLEAALCGCAVLAQDIPSLREVWGDGALYFRDATALSSLLERLYSHPEDLQHVQSGSNNRARQLTAPRMTDQYLTLYRTLLYPQLQRSSEFVAHAI